MFLEQLGKFLGHRTAELFGMHLEQPDDRLAVWLQLRLLQR